jgi:hypothetical protein
MLLEVGQVRVDRRRRGQPDGLPDVPHGGRIAMLADIAPDEVEDLLLPLREAALGHSDPPFHRLILP